MKSALKTLLGILLLQADALCIIISFLKLNIQSGITLLIFTFLFGSLLFWFNGSSLRKLGILAAGNCVGFFWNAVFFSFTDAGTKVFGSAFDPFYTLAYPVLNLLWIVPFWSLSLGMLHRVQPLPTEAKP
jgi:hypothetical protein